MKPYLPRNVVLFPGFVRGRNVDYMPNYGPDRKRAGDVTRSPLSRPSLRREWEAVKVHGQCQDPWHLLCRSCLCTHGGISGTTWERVVLPEKDVSRFSNDLAHGMDEVCTAI